MILHVFCSSWVKPRRRLDYYDNDEEEDDDLSEWVSILITRDIIVSFAAVIRVVTDLTHCFSPVVRRFVAPMDFVSDSLSSRYYISALAIIMVALNMLSRCNSNTP